MGLHQNGWIGTAVLAGISSFVSCALGTALVVVVGLNFANVISRYGFNHALNRADEVEVYLMIGTAFFSGLVADIQRRHLRMDVLRRRFPPCIARLVDGTETLLAIAVCALMTWISWAYTIRIFRIGSHSENAHIPMWIPHRLAVSLQLRSGGGRGALAHVMGACIVMTAEITPEQYRRNFQR